MKKKIMMKCRKVDDIRKVAAVYISNDSCTAILDPIFGLRVVEYRQSEPTSEVSSNDI